MLLYINIQLGKFKKLDLLLIEMQCFFIFGFFDFWFQEVDIGVVLFVVIVICELVIDYVLLYQEDGVGIFMKRVENKVQKFFCIFFFLYYIMWWVVVVVMVVVVYVLYFVVKLSLELKEWELQLGYNIWLIVGIVYG